MRRCGGGVDAEPVRRQSGRLAARAGAGHPGHVGPGVLRAGDRDWLLHPGRPALAAVVPGHLAWPGAAPGAVAAADGRPQRGRERRRRSGPGRAPCSGWPCSPCCPSACSSLRGPDSTSCAGGRRRGSACPVVEVEAIVMHPGRRTYAGVLYPLYVAYVLTCACGRRGTWSCCGGRASRGRPCGRSCAGSTSPLLLFVLGGGYLSFAARGRSRTSPGWGGTCWC